MAAAVIISRPKPVQIDVVQIDAAQTITHSHTNTVTDHPVEEGFNASDHSRPEPDTVQLDCVISNTPISRQQQLRAIQSGSVTVQSTAQVDAPQGQPGYAQSAYNKLYALRVAGTLVTVATPLKTYSSMAITAISIPQTAKDADALRFTISLKYVRVVKNKLTRVVTSKDPRAGGKTKTGNQTPKDTGVDQSRLDSGYEKSKADGKSGVGLIGNTLLNAVGLGG